jgi:tetratricopeptide (TPR) repeat protein
MVGQRLGHYRILEQIGAGGMGVVYRAQDESLGRTVVLKLVGERWLNDPTSRARLLNEARSASALNHPNICTIHEVAEAEGHAYISMEHVEGRPLGSMLLSGGLPTEGVARYGVQIADALAHAHQRGVIHRDLKGSNVVITPEGRVKVLDFGLAKRLGAPELEQATRTRMSLTEAGAVVGTLSYLPPEVLRGKPADERSDIWALGVVLYEMTSGKLPFGGETSFDLTSSILRDAPHPLPPHVPPGLRAVVQRCLAKEPGERYQSAVEVRAALEALQSDSAISALVPAPKAARRLWLWPVAVGLLLIGVGIIAAVIQGVPFTIGYTRISKEEAPAGRRLSTGGPASAKAEANEYFERGMLFLIQQYDLPRARQMLERALEIDPRFAEARAWYGFTDMLMLDSGFSNDSAWVYKAEAELRRALQDDPRLGRAHSALAAVYLLQGRKELVPGEVKLARELNPSDFDAPVQLSTYHLFNGDHLAAEELANQLIAENPTFHVGYNLLAEVRRFRGDTAGTISMLRKVLEQDSENVYVRQSLAHAHMEAGDLQQARRALEEMSPKYRGNFHIREAWAELLALEGRRAEAKKEMDAEVLKFAAANPFETIHAAEYYAILGETEKSLEWLDKAVRAGDERDQWFRRDPLLAGVRNHPRFQQILESVAYRRQQRAAAAK